MALDKQFLKYKLEKIKNKRIWKEQDTETKKRIRKENSKLAAEEADAIHSYLTGEDNIDKLDNKSYMENRLPGSLFLTPKKGRRGKKEYWQGELNIRQVQLDSKTKRKRLSGLLKRFKTIAKSNIKSAKQMVIFKRIFDKLNITFDSEEVKIDGNLQVGSLTFLDGDGHTGLNTEFIVAVAIIAGIATYKRITIRNGLIVKIEPTVLPI